MRQSLTVAVLLALVALAVPASAQRSALIPAAVQDALVNEISGDISFEHIRWFTHYHRPMGGGEGFEAVAKYVEQKAREYGLEDVRVIRQKSNTPSWSPRLGELDAHRALREAPGLHSRSRGVAGRLQPADGALRRRADRCRRRIADADYAGKDVAGKIVLAPGRLRP